MSPSNAKYNFSGKVALVTGSSTGIGEAIAVQLAQYGAKVTITGRDATKLENVRKRIEQISGEVHSVVGDFVTDSDSLPRKLIDETISKFGRLDYLINNAGHATTSGYLASAQLLEGFDAVYKLNVRSVVELTQLAVPYLEKTKGNIVNISSVVAIRPYQLVYSSSKAALDMVTKTTALELGPKGIRVNSINPGPVVTEFLRSIGIHDQKDNQRHYDELTEKSPLKIVGQSEDIANLASFLVSDDARNITGSIFVSDSGYLLS